MNTAETSLPRLRNAIQHNKISFPSQVPIFPRQSRVDIQWRLVELYFVCNWTCDRLGRRYEISGERVQQIIRHWVRRAMVLGYLQEVLPVTLPLASSVQSCPSDLTAAARTLDSDGQAPGAVGSDEPLGFSSTTPLSAAASRIALHRVTS
jgi:hypothetical protein